MSSSKKSSRSKKRTSADDFEFVTDEAESYEDMRSKSNIQGPLCFAAKRSKPDTATAWSKPALKNKIDTDFDAIDFSCTRKSEIGEKWNLKIASWNINGIRALCKKTGFQYVEKENADIVCLQEVRCLVNELPPEVVNIPGYHKYWFPGIGMLSKTKPINVQNGFRDDEELDAEGRVITAEFDKFYVVTVYTPNSGMKLENLPKRRRWNSALLKYLQSLDEKKPVILAGDLNVAHQEIDIARPERNKATAGFLSDERDDMSELLSNDFVDSFRALHPDRAEAYSFWMNISKHRPENIGWRVDYFIISKRFMDRVCDNVLRPDVHGSDHCPIVLYLSV